MARPGQFNGTYTAPVVATPATYASVLGSKLLEYWTVITGMSPTSGNMSTWTGQYAGKVLTATGTNPIGVDTGYFNSRPVLLANRTAANGMVNSSIGLGASTNNYHVFIVGRQRDSGGSSNNYITQIGNGNNDLNTVYDPAATTGGLCFARAQYSPYNAISGTRFAALNHQMYDYYIETAAIGSGLNGGTLTSSGTSTFLNFGAINYVSLGGYPPVGAAASCLYSIALVIICNATCTNAERAGVYAIAKTEFNLP